MKIPTFVITFLINIGSAVCLLLFLLLALNGYSEKDSNWGIYIYLAAAFLTAISTSICGAFAFGFLVNKKGWSAAASAFAAIASFAFVGVILNFVCLFLGVIMANIVRVNF